MSRSRIPILLLLFAAAPAIEAFRLTSLSSLAGRDIWWHLETGLWIFQNHALPHNGIFSQSANLPWAASSWAFDVALASSFRLLALRAIPLALMLFKAMLAVITFLLAGGLRGRFSEAVFMSVIAQYVLGSVPVGSGYCSILLFGIELLIILQFRGSGDRRLLWCLPPLFLLWANFDPQFVYGIGLLLLFVIVSCLESIPRSANLDHNPSDVFEVFGLSLFATLLTPYFYRPWAVFFAIATNDANRYFGNFHAMSFHQPQDYLLLLLTMSAFLALGRRRSRDPFLISLLIACAALSFYSQRDIWLVTLASLAIISKQYSVLDTQFSGDRRFERTRLQPRWSSPEIEKASAPEIADKKTAVPSEMLMRSRWVLETGCWVLAITIAVAVIATLIPSEKMVPKLAEAYPVAAADAVRAQQLPQPVFNSYEFGGFLIWYLHDYPVAIDGRHDLYGPDFLTQYSKAMNADIPYTAYPPMAQARTLVLARESNLSQALAGLPIFKVIYSDRVAFVLEKQDSSQFPVLSSQDSPGGR